MKKRGFSIIILFLILMPIISAPYSNCEIYGTCPVFDPDFFMPTNTSVFGNFSFNGGWTTGGLSIIDGDIYAQTGYFYNLTSLNITKQNLTIITDLNIFGDIIHGGVTDPWVEKSGDTMTGDLTLSGATTHLLLPSNNDATTPTLAFGDGNTGFYESADNSLWVSVAGTARWKLGATAIEANRARSPALLFEDSSSTKPNIVPNRPDTDTGIGWAAADQLSLIAGGVEGMRIVESAGAITHTMTGKVDVANAIAFTDNGAFVNNIAQIYKSAWAGLLLTGFAGTTYDFSIAESAGTVIMANPKDTNNVVFPVGNVGIGTTTPQNTLNVIGDGNFTGNLTLGEKITFAFGEFIDNIVDGWIRITGNLNVTNNLTVGGNVTAENVFLPSFLFAHTNTTQIVVSAGTWYNVTFDEEVSSPKFRITHTHDDDTNDTFIIQDEGYYDIHYTMSFSDATATPSAHIVMRVVKNNIEIAGSLLEEDSSKQYADFTISNGPIVYLETDDEIKFQFTSDDTDVSLTSHRTYGEHHDVGTIKIKRVA